MDNTKYDLIIIGSGPAGLNAALYASRANLKVAFIEKGAPGGKLSATSKIENWIGTELTEGWQLATTFFEHAKKYGAEYIYGDVEKIISHSDLDKEIITAKGKSYRSKTVLIASGMKNRIPTFIENCEKLIDRGVSFCAICDGPLYKGLPSIVLGGGNSAVEEATYLSKIASHVYLVVKDDFFNAEKKLVDELLKIPNIEVFMKSQIVSLLGENKLEGAIVKKDDGTLVTLQVSSFFPYIGLIPVADFAKDFDIFDQRGFIVTDEEMQTSVKGIFAAGDIRSKEIRQIVTAASDGAIAAKKISDLINANLG
ncbi:MULTISPECIES: NAD(P)/FAD-dependent oxidoreductase [unclassified Mycoplasma]|uniref:NAD(P)/FAD-dependent oxidoreductase n=1 Tax=unclassified Mycoplasma TaxID=2683645 RepID=UPI00211C5C4B|nr:MULTISPECIES: NAD(P)/FAD-dependent oxidoreductase [unclassified Mycoplasma]UUM19759.1 NAD(P)/FAD-dependent oxidoreductase [Mycoplasma sp. 1578d]UUM24742.1 NAD(P)/FAD-dependent oxidoreductase [Mycoplasma sp. 3686d]